MDLNKATEPTNDQMGSTEGLGAGASGIRDNGAANGSDWMEAWRSLWRGDLSSELSNAVSRVWWWCGSGAAGEPTLWLPRDKARWNEITGQFEIWTGSAWVAWNAGDAQGILHDPNNNEHFTYIAGEWRHVEIAWKFWARKNQSVRALLLGW